MAFGLGNLREPMPRQIRVEASSFCQLRCPSCPTTAGAIHPAIGNGFLRFDNFRRLIDENPSLARVELSNYGEAFLNPHLLDILQYADAKAVAITLSNGVNLNHATDELLEGLVKYHVRDMTCSIDGASAETYRVYRVRGNFDRVIRHRAAQSLQAEASIGISAAHLAVRGVRAQRARDSRCARNGRKAWDGLLCQDQLGREVLSDP